MPVDDLAAFEVLAASDGPEGTNHTVRGGTGEATAATWAGAVAALWRTPPPRCIVATLTGDPPVASFRTVGGTGLTVVPLGGADRSEVYRCRADTIGLANVGPWVPASPRAAAGDGTATVGGTTADAYVLSAEPAHRYPAVTAHRFHWLAPDGDAAPLAEPVRARHRWRWQIADAARCDAAEAFALDGAPAARSVRAAGWVALRVLGAAALGWRCFRLSGETALTPPPGARPAAAYGWMFQLASEPLLASVRFLSLDRCLTGRYVQIQRTVGSEYLHAAELWASYRGARYRPPAGGCDPPLAGYGWENLIDGNPETFAHCDASPSARFWIDLGVDRPIDRVEITNRSGLFARMVGATVSVVSAAGVVRWRFPIAAAAAAWDLSVPPPHGDAFEPRLADGRPLRCAGAGTAPLTLRAEGDPLGPVTLRRCPGAAGDARGYAALVTDGGACVRGDGAQWVVRGPFEPSARACYFQAVRLAGGFGLFQDGLWACGGGDGVVLAGANPLLFRWEEGLDPAYLSEAPAPF